MRLTLLLLISGCSLGDVHRQVDCNCRCTEEEQFSCTITDERDETDILHYPPELNREL